MATATKSALALLAFSAVLAFVLQEQWAVSLADRLGPESVGLEAWPGMCYSDIRLRFSVGRFGGHSISSSWVDVGFSFVCHSMAFQAYRFLFWPAGPPSQLPTKCRFATFDADAGGFEAFSIPPFILEIVWSHWTHAVGVPVLPACDKLLHWVSWRQLTYSTSVITCFRFGNFDCQPRLLRIVWLKGGLFNIA